VGSSNKPNKLYHGIWHDTFVVHVHGRVDNKLESPSLTNAVKGWLVGSVD